MKKNSTDIFESTKQNPFEKEDKSNNFFLMDETPLIQIQRASSDSTRRLNDYDFNLLKEDAYKDVSDDLFKLEYKISKLENILKDIESQIQAARDIQDYDLIDELVIKMIAVKSEYDELVSIYNEKSISTRISGGIMNLFGEKFQKKITAFKSHFSGVSDLIISKMPKRFSSILELKKTLNKLENINKSVNELMTMNSPYGENSDKYAQLSKYIIRANAIQGEISRYINNK